MFHPVSELASLIPTVSGSSKLARSDPAATKVYIVMSTLSTPAPSQGDSRGGGGGSVLKHPPFIKTSQHPPWQNSGHPPHIL